MNKNFIHLLLALFALVFSDFSKAEECGLCNQAYASCLSKGGASCDLEFRSCKSACMTGQPITRSSASSAVSSFFGNTLIAGFVLFVAIVAGLMLYLAVGPRLKNLKERSLQAKINSDPKLKEQHERHQKLEGLRWKAYRMTVEEMANETGLSERSIKAWLDRQGLESRKVSR